MYLVAEITSTSTPSASGLKKSGAAQVLSITVCTPRALAAATIAGTSWTSKVSEPGLSR